MKRFLLALSMCALIALTSVAMSSADEHHGRRKLINSDVIGSTPNITIRGVAAGGAPWVLEDGRAQLDSSGRLRVRVEGLVIGAGALASGDPVPANLVGTVAGVTTVHAALTCGGPGGGTPFTITPSDGVPLSAAGDFEINAQLTIPDACDHPILLIRIGTPAAAGPWIAAAAPKSSGHDDDD